MPVRTAGATNAAMPDEGTIARTPEPPYYAVIFTSLQTDDLDGYDETSARMLELAAAMPEGGGGINRRLSGAERPDRLVTCRTGSRGLLSRLIMR